MMICARCHSENSDTSKFCGGCGGVLSQAGGVGQEGATVTRTLEAPAVTLKPGSLIAGKYKVIEEIGRGGMGVVFKAEDIRLKRSVALKFLPPQLIDLPELKERFLVEAQAAAALNHPNICTIYEVGEDEARPYIAMEFVDGETLKDKLRQGPLKAEEALKIAGQVAAGLGEAHHKGIIHRDIKSANIMATAKGQAKVMDFGLAKLRGGSSLTKSQTTVGTVAYMSPEQARGERLDRRTDIWSLGVVLYEMLAGKLPFQGDRDQTLIYSILHKEPESLVKIRPALAPELEHTVLQALTKKAADRYKTMEELREDLAAIAEGLKPLKAKAKPYEPEKSIAVLPFINDSPDRENTYFINGVMEEILGNLQKIKALRVISRTSVEQYRERKKSVREIAEELGVNYIVEGSAQKYGNAFRLRAQLIMASRETHIWGDSFQRKITDMEDIFDIQTKIAEAIAGELKAVISPEEKRLIEKIPTDDLGAYDAFLKGKFATYRTTPEGFDAAIQYFEQAKERDPRFALPYAGIGFVWMARQQLGIASPDEAGPQLMEAVGKALELDSTLAEVQFALANMKVFGMWDWEGGESAYQRALEINPNHAEAHGLYSLLLSALGRPEEAMDHIELALKLDPQNPMIRIWYSAALLFVRRYDDCVSVGRAVLEKDPSLFLVLDQVKDALHLLGRYGEALEASRSYYSHLYQDFDHVFDQYERLGYAGTLSLEADTLMEQSKSKYVCPNDIATLYVHAGDKERALDCLEQAYEKRDSNIVYTGVRSVFAVLSDEPRFQGLLRKLKLPAGPLQ
jgi:serine/threonine protein kinase